MLRGSGPLSEFGRLLHQTWEIKKNLTNNVSNTYIDDVYNAARKAGAIGGKLLGAGGGGFMLIFVEPPQKRSVSHALEGMLQVPFKFEELGSQIIFEDDLSG